MNSTNRFDDNSTEGHLSRHRTTLGLKPKRASPIPTSLWMTDSSVFAILTVCTARETWPSAACAPRKNARSSLISVGIVIRFWDPYAGDGTKSPNEAGVDDHRSSPYCVATQSPG